jgi:hypothetical protein
VSNKCINTNSVEFQTNLKKSGLSEFDYAIEVDRYFDLQRDMGVPEEELKYPELDRVQGADSSAYLEENIKLKDNGANIQDILAYTKTRDIAQATISINNTHRDLEVSILPLNEQALVTIAHRPNEFKEVHNEPVNISKDKAALIPIFNKLASLYGIHFHNVTIAELIHNEKFKDVLDAKHTNAFILNGDIYINMDVADIDAPIHEMSHLLLGSVKYQNPELYAALVDVVEQLPAYEEVAKEFQGRTRSDLNEEIFVTEFAKFISNKNSLIHELPEFVQEEILYNIKRLLDSMLMGDTSVKTIPVQHLTSLSLPSIAELVNSTAFDNVSRGSLTISQQHRILNNRKADLMKSNDLIEECL